MRPFLSVAGGSIDLVSVSGSGGIQPTVVLKLEGKSASLFSVKNEMSQRIHRHFMASGYASNGMATTTKNCATWDITPSWRRDRTLPELDAIAAAATPSDRDPAPLPERQKTCICAEKTALCRATLGPSSSYCWRVWQTRKNSPVDESILPPNQTAKRCIWWLMTLTSIFCGWACLPSEPNLFTFASSLASTRFLTSRWSLTTEVLEHRRPAREHDVLV